MSFKEGFDAIARVKASGEKLGETIGRIEKLEGWLSELRKAQADAGAIFETAKSSINQLEDAATVMKVQQETLLNEVRALPASVQDILLAAEQKFTAKHAAIEQIITRLPEIIETAIEQKLTSIVTQMEMRLNERLRDELKDTRTTLRETLEHGASRTEMRLEEIKKDIVAELPRGLFGRRGS